MFFVHAPLSHATYTCNINGQLRLTIFSDISSIISKASAATPKDLLNGVNDYNGDQIKVEPNFSPGTEKERRAVYEPEAPFVKEFQYADLPGYAVVTVSPDQVAAKIYSGTSRQLWRSVKLAGAA